MGWAIKRADGTYRCWNAFTQDDALQIGESWESRASMPLLTPEAATPTSLDNDAQRTLDDQKLLKAIALWTAAKLGVTPSTARAEIKAIYRTL